MTDLETRKSETSLLRYLQTYKQLAVSIATSIVLNVNKTSVILPRSTSVDVARTYTALLKSDSYLLLTFEDG